MPANARALRATNIYREHVGVLRTRAEGITRRNWLTVGGDLDATHAAFAARTAAALTQLQAAGARISTGYLAAYVAVSNGRLASPTGSSAAVEGIGQSRTGKPLVEALASPLIAVKAAIKDGRSFEEAHKLGGAIVLRNAAEDVVHTTRAALFDGIASNDSIVGWRRVTSGGCGACMALADGAILPDDSDLEVHDNCQCTGEPVVRDARDDVRRPTGLDMFEAMAPEEQDQLLGPDKAQIVRNGDVPFHALVARSPMEAIPDQITEAPLEALKAHSA